MVTWSVLPNCRSSLCVTYLVFRHCTQDIAEHVLRSNMSSDGIRIWLLSGFTTFSQDFYHLWFMYLQANNSSTITRQFLIQQCHQFLCSRPTGRIVVERKKMQRNMKPFFWLSFKLFSVQSDCNEPQSS